jgi:hypothetical protein
MFSSLGARDQMDRPAVGYRHYPVQCLYVFVSTAAASAIELSVVEKITADQASFHEQAGRSLMHHLSNDARKRIQADYINLRGTRLAQ